MLCTARDFSRPYLHLREAEEQIISLKSTTNVTIKAHIIHTQQFILSTTCFGRRPTITNEACRDLNGNYTRFYIIL